MNPTLKPGDRLFILPYAGQRIRRGDVVVFVPPRGDSKIIHRVVSVHSQGIRTRGDNNNELDQWFLSPEHVLGRVVWAQRKNIRRRIFGGPPGQLLAAILRGIHAVDSAISSVLRRAYVGLARKGIFRRWLPGQIRPRVISLDRAADKELQLLMGRRVIGRWLPGRSRWHIWRPFRLFVDEASLPENTAEVSGVPPEADQLAVANKDM